MVTKKEKTPEFVFKYERCNTQLLQNLADSVIYMQAPREFNDPYDSLPDNPIPKISMSELEMIKAQCIRNNTLPDFIEFLDKARVPSLQEQVLVELTSIINTKKAEVLDQIGVSCFSETNDNLLMWAHYADSFKGICVEYSTEELPFSKIDPVYYSDEVAKLDPVRLLSPESVDEVRRQYLTKSCAWKYEREWRIVVLEGKQAWHVKPGIVKAIYFGPLMKPSLMKIVMDISSMADKKIDYYRGLLSRDQFLVEFIKVDRNELL